MPEDLEAWALIVLVVVTAYYAIQTRLTVRQMAKATRAQQMPRLVMLMGYSEDDEDDDDEEDWTGVWIWNAGPGPATNADLEVTFIGNANVDEYKQKVPVSVIAGDMQVEVDGPPSPDGKSGVTLDQLCRDYRRITLTGEVTDSIGKKVKVRAELDDLAKFAVRDGTRFRLHHDRTFGAVSGIHDELKRLRRHVIGDRQGSPSEGGSSPDSQP